MTRILGHNYIGGQRSAAGSIKLHSVDASTGETLPHDFFRRHRRKSMRRPTLPRTPIRPIAA